MMITLGSLNAAPFGRHAFFTRIGGHSGGIYRALNCGPGSQDRPEHVAGNRAICAEMLGLEADRLVTLRQVHSASIVTVEEPWPPNQAPIADGLVTATPGIALGVLTADCTPILMVDPSARDGNGVIAALHAGWRGAKGGIIAAGVEAMVALGAHRERILAAIGPCLHQASYQVGSDFHDDFLSDDASNAAFFVPCANAPGKFRFDLPGYVGAALNRAGIGHVQQAQHDTYTEAARFFSYRRATHLGEPDYGRQLSAIVLGG